MRITWSWWRCGWISTSRACARTSWRTATFLTALSRSSSSTRDRATRRYAHTCSWLQKTRTTRLVLLQSTRLEPCANMLWCGCELAQYLLTASDGHRYVVRKQPPGHLLAGAHNVGREYTVLDALKDTDVPVPRTLLFCDDPAVIGTVSIAQSLDYAPWLTTCGIPALSHYTANHLLAFPCIV